MIQNIFNLFTRLRRFLLWLWRQEGTPAQRARGLAVGVFSGCFPFFGFQTLIGIFLASVCRGNHLLAAAGTWVSNPLTYIPLYWFNYKVGEVFLGVDRNLQNLDHVTKSQLWDQGLIFSVRLLIGSSFVGFVLGSIVGVLFYLLFKSRSRLRTFN